MEMRVRNLGEKYTSRDYKYNIWKKSSSYGILFDLSTSQAKKQRKTLPILEAAKNKRVCTYKHTKFTFFLLSLSSQDVSFFKGRIRKKHWGCREGWRHYMTWYIYRYRGARKISCIVCIYGKKHFFLGWWCFAKFNDCNVINARKKLIFFTLAMLLCAILGYVFVLSLKKRMRIDKSRNVDWVRSAWYYSFVEISWNWRKIHWHTLWVRMQEWSCCEINLPQKYMKEFEGLKIEVIKKFFIQMCK